MQVSPALSGRNDVRWPGESRTTTLQSRSFTGRWDAGDQLHRQPPTSTRRASPRSSSARRWPEGRRDDVILATKFHGPMDVAMGQPGGDPNKRGNSRRWVVQEVENSLRRLGTDWIDLYQVHRPDRHNRRRGDAVPPLTDLQRQGQDQGVSAAPPSRRTSWSRRTGFADRRGAWAGFVTEQPPYSILVRGDRGGRAAGGAAIRHGCAAVEPVWLGVGSPGPTGRVRDLPTSRRAEADFRAGTDLSKPENQRKLDAADSLARGWADKAGISLIHLALGVRAWAHPGGDLADQSGPAHHGAPGVAAGRGRRWCCPPRCWTRSTTIVPARGELSPGPTAATSPSLRGRTRRCAARHNRLARNP